MRKVIFALLFISAAASAAPCDQAVRAAYEAYLMSTFDAKQPNPKRQAEALEFRLSQQPFATDEIRAYMALGYISRRLRDAGVRAVYDYEVAAVATEYINKECR